ncbi:LacI family DNA-binding transcriptional regulator [Halalkalibacter sp. AB-rgal2]|uniref:LacI family DNA-binding transcriptional regulator n=1 Tax=Halalkalibacter sp. AB-rgal2 TaxID=3242695 RepID=UPI00359E82F3
MANIHDIAKMAGVSVTTVSRVLNGHRYVRKEKKEAVLRAVRESNYHRNINAVHLSRGKTSLVGVVVPFANDPYFGLLIEGITRAAANHGYHLVLVQTNYDEKRELEALKMLENRQIDALIICSRQSTWDIIEAYMNEGSIVMCEDTRGKGVSATFVNHYQAFMMALDYLYDNGHRNIGYCVGRRNGANSLRRAQAYKNFHNKYSLSLNEANIFYECYHLEDGQRVAKKLSTMEDRPSAMLITSDQVAAGVMTCCLEEGIKVPKDLALMGFDNQPIAKLMHLTTIEIPIVKLGEKLFQQAIQNNKEPTYEEVIVKLIERETV